jgi:hypothetical protein
MDNTGDIPRGKGRGEEGEDCVKMKGLTKADGD